jgi:hypothetical protein
VNLGCPDRARLCRDPHLLAAFVALAQAQPEEMAAFMQTYGVLELCARHGLPAWHGDRGCVIGEPGAPYLDPAAVRRCARGFAAARRLGDALSARKAGQLQDWADLQAAAGRGWPANPVLALDVDDANWRLGRAKLANWLTVMLRACRVSPAVVWEPRHRLHVTSVSWGPLGKLVVLLTRELGQGDAYVCDVCNAPVSRTRPPREGERVYCSKPACRREQQRRNQAAWRDKKRRGPDYDQATNLRRRRGLSAVGRALVRLSGPWPRR